MSISLVWNAYSCDVRSKLLTEVLFLYLSRYQCHVHPCIAAIIGFREVTLEVVEGVGPVSLTVAVLGDMLATNAEVTVRLYTEARTASGQ